MGLHVTCPSGHRLHLKSHLAGKRGICPQCGAKFVIPAASAPAEARPTGDSRTDAPAPPSKPAVPAAEFASQSVIISVVEPVTASAPAAATVQPEIRPAPADAKIPSRAPIAPSLVEPTAAPSSATVFAARQRRRRKQLQLAGLLLIAVVVLALLLVWVLRFGPAASGAASGATNALAEIGSTSFNLHYPGPLAKVLGGGVRS